MLPWGDAVHQSPPGAVWKEGACVLRAPRTHSAWGLALPGRGLQDGGTVRPHTSLQTKCADAGLPVDEDACARTSMPRV